MKVGKPPKMKGSYFYQRKPILFYSTKLLNKVTLLKINIMIIVHDHVISRSGSLVS